MKEHPAEAICVSLVRHSVVSPDRVKNQSSEPEMGTGLVCFVKFSDTLPRCCVWFVRCKWPREGEELVE
jgi:hypothetical protein